MRCADIDQFLVDKNEQYHNLVFIITKQLD